MLGCIVEGDKAWGGITVTNVGTKMRQSYRYTATTAHDLLVGGYSWGSLHCAVHCNCHSAAWRNADLAVGCIVAYGLYKHSN